jgi:4-amino-4-deoxy-L-arabinose transferase-like glycosyltransferase
MAEDSSNVAVARPARRLTTGAVVAGVTSFAVFAIMAHAGHLPAGVPLGGVLAIVASLALAGAFVVLPSEPTSARVVSVQALRRPLLGVGASLAAFTGGLAGAQAGVLLPQWAWGWLVTAACIAVAAYAFRVAEALGVTSSDPGGDPGAGGPRPLWRHPGFWIVALASVLYLPRLGMSSLWDPWETHYGEVAREMLSRDDWISTWWANEGFFFSKPPLDMWLQALAMATLGVHYQPDKVLVGDGTLPTMHPEWATRAPIILIAILAIYSLYKGVAASLGPRAATLGALVLMTCPLWLFVAHQTMTDMPFVGTMTACMAMVLLGFATPPEREASVTEITFGRRRLRVSAQHLVLGFIALSVLPVALYLLSRNAELLWQPGAHGFRVHWDEFRSGSGGAINCSLPGSEDCKPAVSALVAPGLDPGTATGFLRRSFGAFEPVLQGVLWLGALGWILATQRRERRLRRLYYLAAWTFAGLSTLAKGPGGFALPMLVVFVTLCASGRGTDLVGRLEDVLAELAHSKLAVGVLVVVAAALPWYVAMYVRHGTPFTDRLIFHDMLGRVSARIEDKGVVDDFSFRYYVCQLGYGMFPWIGLLPLGLAMAFTTREGGAGEGAGGAPPTHSNDDEQARTLVLLGMWCLCGFALFAFMGTKYYYYILPVVPAAAMLVGAVLDRLLSTRDEDPQASRILAAGATAGALLVALIVRDLTLGDETTERPAPIRLLQLFTYNYDRLWPGDVNLVAPIALFGIAAAVVFALLAVQRVRRVAVGAACLVGIAWAAWCTDVFMTRLAPHWGQREVISAYYADRASPDEKLVAYQMNWKGENFYTGNHIAIFVSTGNTFSTWLTAQKEHGARVMYFVTEQGRVGGLKREVGAKSYRELTDRALCNKFILVRAEL